MRRNSGSLLDIHKYSKEALHELYNSLCEIFEEKNGNFKSITSFIIRIVREDEIITNIIQKMDKVDSIKAQNSKSVNEKRVETWLKKAYYEHLYGSFSISRNHLLAFMITIIKPNSEEGKKKLKYSSTRYFEQYNDKFKKRLKRCRENERVLELQQKYPKLNIIDAFAYGQIIDKFNTTNEDLEWFEKMVKILTKKKE
jgi:hypothetical protein